MTVKSEEKRLFTRLDVSAEVRYQIVGEQTSEQGTLDNVSAGGVLFWSKRQLHLGTQLRLTIDPDRRERKPIQIIATVVRIKPVTKDGHFGYGCRIDATENAQDSLTYRGV